MWKSINEKLKNLKDKKIEYSKYKNPSCEANFQCYEEKDPIKIDMINELKGFLHVCIFTSKSFNLKFDNPLFLKFFESNTLLCTFLY